MPTEAGKRAARELARRKMAGETNQAFAARATVDPQTLGDFLAGRRWPIAATLAKIDSALDLTPGTLAAIGEDPEPVASPVDRNREAPSIRDATDEELLAELGYRMVQLRRDAELAHRESLKGGGVADPAEQGGGSAGVQVKPDRMSVMPENQRSQPKPNR